LDKVTRLITGRKGKRSKKDWDKFLEEWTISHNLTTVYKARAILADKTEEAYKLLTMKSKTPADFSTLEVRLRDAGAAYILSETLYLDPRRMGKEVFETDKLSQVLKKAYESEERLTEVLSLGQSYVVLEVIELLSPLSPEDLAMAARGSYEGLVKGEAFKEFMDEMRKNSVIEINPNFPELTTTSSSSTGTTTNTNTS
jgi:hypothetical protein